MLILLDKYCCLKASIASSLSLLVGFIIRELEFYNVRKTNIL